MEKLFEIIRTLEAGEEVVIRDHQGKVVCSINKSNWFTISLRIDGCVILNFGDRVDLQDNFLYLYGDDKITASYNFPRGFTGCIEKKGWSF